MPGARGVGSRSSQTRADIVRAAADLMLEQGYASVTYRSVGARAQVTPGLVQYYFPVLDDLFVEILEAGTDDLVRRLERAAGADRPLRAIWAYANDKAGAALLLEFMALANHRKAVGPVIGRGGERLRQALVAALVPALRRYGLAADERVPAAVVFLMSAVPRMIQLEESFGTVTGHAEMIDLVEDYLDRVEPLAGAETDGPPITRG
ncbi:TetR/AcrR family transcriptional regulator [Nocardia sp. alder85J]|uniref:TetR/AcrR family transcriptional regulator n=1 Tax=Nocardia sp. alder85J TaxID=2862949 RepID=UPI001CD64DFA|nr:TetR/AcrR family transcriptional regulator [Nocardia sp. alder85J]MCX4091951.1 TetR/AcrR family transcriptional regulator [Nocardia sp. alder85J]